MVGSPTYRYPAGVRVTGSSTSSSFCPLPLDEFATSMSSTWII